MRKLLSFCVLHKEIIGKIKIEFFFKIESICIKIFFIFFNPSSPESQVIPLYHGLKLATVSFILDTSEIITSNFSFCFSHGSNQAPTLKIVFLYFNFFFAMFIACLEMSLK